MNLTPELSLSLETLPVSELEQLQEQEQEPDLPPGFDFGTLGILSDFNVAFFSTEMKPLFYSLC